MRRLHPKTVWTSSVHFQPLEPRTLLSNVIDVTSFGARPNDGADDRGAVLAAVNASAPGDTIRFSGGTFNISDSMSLPGDRTYKGENNATLQGRGGDGALIDFHANNITLTGLTFNGGGIFIDQPAGGMNQNIVIDHNVFRLNTWGSKSNAITFTSGLRNSRITNNYFTGYTGAFGVYGYNYNGLTITNNEFVDVTAGMHIDAFGGCGNLLVQNNYIKGAKGMGMEFQGSASNNKYYDNVYEHPNLSSVYNQNLNSMAFSLILDKSSNIEIKRNTVIAPERPDGTGTRVGFEVGGDNAIVEDNYINGVSITVADNDGVGSGSVVVRNNKFMNYQHGDYQAFPAPGRTYQSFNNGPDIQLTWDINRPHPGIDGGAPAIVDAGSGTTTDTGGTTTPGNTGNNTTPPPAPAVPLEMPANLQATPVNGTSVKITWDDVSSKEYGYRIKASTDGGATWITFGVVGKNVTSFTADYLESGKTYSFKVCTVGVSVTTDSDYAGPVQVTIGDPSADQPSNVFNPDNLNPNHPGHWELEEPVWPARGAPIKVWVWD